LLIEDGAAALYPGNYSYAREKRAER